MWPLIATAAAVLLFAWLGRDVAPLTASGKRNGSQRRWLGWGSRWFRGSPVELMQPRIVVRRPMARPVHSDLWPRVAVIGFAVAAFLFVIAISRTYPL